MPDYIYERIEEAVKRDTTSAIHGAVGGLADAQAKLISLLLKHGILTSLAAQQMIGELHSAEYPQPPLTSSEHVRREIVKWVAEHLQGQVEWDQAADQ